MGTISTRARPADSSLARVAVAPLEFPLPVAELGAVPTSEDLLRERRDLPAGHPDRFTIRARVVEANLPMAIRLARRYGGRGELFDDLAQVAALALVKAVDAYDSDRLVPFSGYAVPSIVGALKRHFRDSTSAMRVPRSAREMNLRVRAATDHLSQLHAQQPTSTKLAAHLHVRVDDITAAALAARAYRTESLDKPRMRDDGTGGGDHFGALGGIEPGYGHVDDAVAVGGLMAALPVRERRILTMRFYDEMSQASIAAELGVSQMQISRLLRRTLTRIRLDLVDADPGRG